MEILCPRCQGEGVVPSPDAYDEGFLDEPCDLCGGEGWLEVEERDEDTR